jgi:GLPGLI family protein
MKYILIIIIGIFTQNILLGQENITVKYNSVIFDEKDDYGSFLSESTTLITNSKESLYIETPKDTIFNNGDTEFNNEGADYKFEYYKDLGKHTVVYNRSYGFETVIKDDDCNIKWILRNNFKFVMNYKCQEAVCTFRGRDYHAYFLKDLPYSSGPFKFGGLPGIILQIESDDKAVQITAYEISFDNDTIINPFITTAKTITWIDFKKKYKERFEKFLNYTPQDGVSYTIPNRYIEYFVE